MLTIKLDQLKAAALKGDWRGALRIAAKFGQLGDQKAAIMRGHEAHKNAAFARQLGRDPEADIEAGIAALCTRYALNRDGTDAVRYYTEARNAIRAARKALGAEAKQSEDFTLIQAEAGSTWAAIVPEAKAPAPHAAPKADKPAKAAKAAPAPAPPAAAPKAPRMHARYVEMQAAAERGVMPPAPDFSAPTHKAYRGKLAQLVALAEAGDAASLAAYAIKNYDSSMAALVRYRDMALTAIRTAG